MGREALDGRGGAAAQRSPDAPAPASTISPLLGKVIAVGPATASPGSARTRENARRPSVLLPICAYCKRVRAGDADPKPGDPPSTWGAFESVVFSRGNDTGFTHSVCPECYEREILPQLERLKHKRSGLAAG
jgi:hypothetical protein